MAYTTGTLSYLAGGPVEGAWKLWEYTTTDLVSATKLMYVIDIASIYSRDGCSFPYVFPYIKAARRPLKKVAPTSKPAGL